MSKLPPLTLVIIYRIDGKQQAMMFGNGDEKWQTVAQAYEDKLKDAGHKVRRMRMWRCNEPWPLTGLKRCSPNIFQKLLIVQAKIEGTEAKQFADMVFVPYRIDPRTKNQTARFAKKK